MRFLCKVACGLAFPFLIRAQAITLGTAAPFGVLGASTVTNTGPTVIDGDLGVSPGTAITNFPPGTFTGSEHVNDAVAAQAQADALNAYNIAAGIASTEDLSSQNLGGRTLTPGVYTFTSSAQLTGALTLNAEGNSNAQFVFQIDSTLTTASDASVIIENGAQACNVIWQIGSSATLGSNTTFIGIILAHTSITAVTGTTVSGSLIALTGAVTLDSNIITVVNTCSTTTTTTTTTTTSITASTTTTSTTPTTTSTLTTTTTPMTTSTSTISTTPSAITSTTTTTSTISTTTSITPTTTSTSTTVPTTLTTLTTTPIYPIYPVYPVYPQYE
ncbi:hypothetical protein B7463_g2830, partial [Scytalidium lignicola]